MPPILTLVRGVQSQLRLSTISPIAPFQSTLSNVQTPAPVSDDGTSDQKSFADCLKETHDDSDKDSQTTTESSRSQTSPKRAAENHREPHRRTAGAAPSSVIAGVITQPPVLDSRSLMLSLQKPASGKTTASAIAPAAAPDASASAAPKGNVAFGVSISNQSGNAPTQAAQQIQDGQHGQANAKNSGDSEEDTPANAAAAASLKDSTQAAAATAIPAATQPAVMMPQSVPAAYAHAQAETLTANTPVVPAAPSAPVAPVVEAPVTPAVRTHAIDIQVPGTGGDGVDVRVSQRAGDVQVTVRTPNDDLAQSLRQHLPELSDRLNQTGTTSQIWQPAAAGETSTGSGTTHDEPGSSWQGQQQNPQSQPQADPDAEQNQRGGQWVDDFYNAEQEAL